MSLFVRCDNCDKEGQPSFLTWPGSGWVTVKANLEHHFCGHKCMKSWAVMRMDKPFTTKGDKRDSVAA